MIAGRAHHELLEDQVPLPDELMVTPGHPLAMAERSALVTEIDPELHRPGRELESAGAAGSRSYLRLEHEPPTPPSSSSRYGERRMELTVGTFHLPDARPSAAEHVHGWRPMRTPSTGWS